MDSKYVSLDAELRRAGFFTNGVEPMGDWDRTTACSKQMPGGIGYSGNSFWVTLLSNLLYRLPDNSRIASFCIAWLKRYPETVLTDFDDDIKLEFNLAPVTDDEFDAIAGETVDYD